MLGGKPKGISLHVGLNRVDPVHYVGWKEELVACENDARDMEAITRSQGFVTQSLLTRSATSTSLLGIIEKAAKERVEGDIFVLTYSATAAKSTISTTKNLMVWMKPGSCMTANWSMTNCMPCGRFSGPGSVSAYCQKAATAESRRRRCS